MWMKMNANVVRWLPICSVAALLAASACGGSKEPAPGSGPHAAQVAAARTPLPTGAYRVRWDAHAVPAQLRAGDEADVRVTFTNLGDAVWPDDLSGDPERRDGAYAVRLAYQWAELSADLTLKPARRVDLPYPLRPNETLTLLVHVKAPDRPGSYQLVFELVQELVAWFDAKGAAPLVVPVTIT